jgi:hypothetical protein
MYDLVSKREYDFGLPRCETMDGALLSTVVVINTYPNDSLALATAIVAAFRQIYHPRCSHVVRSER